MLNRKVSKLYFLFQQENDGEDDMDLDMDNCDTRMLSALDKTLENIFKQRKEKQMEKKEKKAAQEALNHFKLRVLDLFTIFLKEQPNDKKVIVSMV